MPIQNDGIGKGHIWLDQHICALATELKPDSITTHYKSNQPFTEGLPQYHSSPNAVQNFQNLK